MKHTPARTCPSWHEAYMVVGTPPSEDATYLGCDDLSHWRRPGMPLSGLHWRYFSLLLAVARPHVDIAWRGESARDTATHSNERRSAKGAMLCAHTALTTPSPKDCRGLNGLVGLETGPGDPFVRGGLVCTIQAQARQLPPVVFHTRPATTLGSETVKASAGSEGDA